MVQGTRVKVADKKSRTYFNKDSLSQRHCTKTESVGVYVLVRESLIKSDGVRKQVDMKGRVGVNVI